MLARSALLMIYAIAKGSGWFLEQPSTSLMCEHEAMKYVRSLASRMTMN